MPLFLRAATVQYDFIEMSERVREKWRKSHTGINLISTTAISAFTIRSQLKQQQQHKNE
jgi:hypothetical protein